jgi:hypothetical protein
MQTELIQSPWLFYWWVSHQPYTGFEDNGLLARMELPHMRFLFVGPEVCLRLPSDSTSQCTPLPSG